MLLLFVGPSIARRFPIMPVLLFLVTVCHAQSKEPGFRIDGIAKGMADSTLLYLQIKRDSGGYEDSSYVLNERFSFSGKLNAPVEYALIRTRPLTDYKFVWLENTSMTFNGEKGSFREAILTGSATEDEDRALYLSLEKVDESDRADRKAAYVSTHPGSIISAHLLSVYAATWGKERSSKLYEGLSAEVKETPYGKTVAQFLSLTKDPKVGDQYTDFTQPDINGKPVSLSDFKGKLVLLEFWGSWCGPCRKSNPELVKIYHEFSAKGFAVLGVASETNRNAWINAIEKDKLPWTNVTELKGDKNSAAIIYAISYYPSNFLIDQSGTIIARDITGNELRRMLKKHLGSKQK
ncbi:AhpC/TSA family protein [Chryseolinea sp. T2]|uniref:AhpC/TSA family protein n=1 Tax=Chryseolinea sp. T2 TaxID=3129255 RepID=UPI00307866CC